MIMVLKIMMAIIIWWTSHDSSAEDLQFELTGRALANAGHLQRISRAPCAAFSTLASIHWGKSSLQKNGTKNILQGWLFLNTWDFAANLHLLDWKSCPSTPELKQLSWLWSKNRITNCHSGPTFSMFKRNDHHLESTLAILAYVPCACHLSMLPVLFVRLASPITSEPASWSWTRGTLNSKNAQ